MSKDLLNPSITIGITTGLNSFIICAVPFRIGLNGVVVPWGKVITHPSFSAIPILEISLIFTCLLISFPLSLQVLSIETEPAYAKILGRGPAFIVSLAATKYILSFGFHR